MMVETLEKPSDQHLSQLRTLGKTMLTQGNYRESLAAFLEAFMLCPDAADIQESLINVLSKTSGFKLPKDIVDKLANAVLENGHDAQQLALLLANQVEDDENVQAVISFIKKTEPGTITELVREPDLATVLDDQLLLLVSTKATNISPVIEELLIAVRRQFLGEWLADASSISYFLECHPSALSAAACQAYNSQYIFDVSEEEERLVNGLQESILEDLRSVHPMELAILGAYRPLFDVLKSQNPEDLQYLADQAQQWPIWVQLVWKIQFLSPFQEALSMQSIPFLSAIQSDHSAMIANQYEAHPYPRWQSAKVPTHKQTLKDYLATRFPAADITNINDAPAKILFAGCGTGEQLATMGSAIQAENTLAIDLSMTSLCYASRKIQEFALENIHFGQADILGISDWNASFDLIVCTGVLHHMESIDTGFEALASGAHEDTVYCLALYSERARENVVAARELVEEKGIPDTVDGLRSFRNMLRNLPQSHPAKSVMNCREFFSASGLHDYVFNKHEIRLTPLELKAFLERHGLELLGFDISRSDMTTAYLADFPEDPSMTDLDNWEKFEQNHPDVFGRMMQFWCRKKKA